MIKHYVGMFFWLMKALTTRCVELQDSARIEGGPLTDKFRLQLLQSRCITQTHNISWTNHQTSAASPPGCVGRQSGVIQS